MLDFLQHGVTEEELLKLNQCRLFLKAYYVPDLADGSGLTLLEEAWNGCSAHIQHRQHTWPNQENPP
jgi:hypothetical protein